MDLPYRVHQLIMENPILWKGNGNILVACSGGPDSVALVHILQSVSKGLPLRFSLVHADHSLRGAESKRDARFVEELGKKFRWPVYVVSCPVSKKEPGNLEEKARVKRYEAFVRLSQRLKSHFIFTAHNLDDQVETVLMNLSRGAGPEGLGGMSPLRWLNPSVRIFRPLLQIPKKDILGYLKQHNVSYRKDQSNRDIQFFRNWMRRKLIPAWESRTPALKRQVSKLALILGEEQEAWEKMVQAALDVMADPFRKGIRLDRQKLDRYPLALQRRILRRVAGPDLLTFDGIERLMNWMKAPPSGGRTLELKKGWVVERLSKSKGSPSAALFWFHALKRNQNQRKRK